MNKTANGSRILLHSSEERTYKVDERISSILVEVDLSKLSILGEDALELLVGNVAG